MIRRKDILEGYSPEKYDPQYYSPFYNEDIEKIADSRINEIFDFYEPRILAEKLAGLDVPMINTRRPGRFIWGIKIQKKKCSMEFFSESRPDEFFFKYEMQKELNVIKTFERKLYNFDDSNFREHLNQRFASEINPIIENFPLAIDNMYFETRVYSEAFSNRIYSESLFKIKQIPALSRIQYLEYNLPKIIHDLISKIEI